jgi:hypothetical protein
MELPIHVLLVYGYLLLFAWILVEQFGIPLPATPILLAAGALSAEGQLRFSLALASGVIAALTADSTWFLIGRKYGHHVLRLLCKMSMEPTICVRLVWPPPRGYAHDRQIRSRPGHSGSARSRSERHGLWQVSAL